MQSKNWRRCTISIILNEREYAESILSYKTTTKKPSEALSIISRYLHSSGYKPHEIAKRLEDYIIRIDENASIPKWQQTIDRYANTADKYSLVEIDSVPVTQSELDTILTISSKPLKRLAFTLLCVAKFYNISNPHNNNWTNKPDREIFKLANIQTSSMKQSLMMNDLYSLGLIGYSKLVDNINVSVKFIDNDSDVVLHISDFRNLGFQYLRYAGDTSFTECESCGLIMKRTSNRLKYCPDCAIDIDRAKSAERWRRSSETKCAV